MKEKIIKKINEFEEYCNNDLDMMNDLLSDFFYEQLEKKELFWIINEIKNK